MKRVELNGQVRHAVIADGMSNREATCQFGIDPRRVEKMLKYLGSRLITLVPHSYQGSEHMLVLPISPM